MSYKKYWIALAIVIIGSFAVLGGGGAADDQPSPAASRCLYDGWAASFHRQLHHRRAGRVAVHRRAGDWHSVGTRRVRGSRLERGLAASRIKYPSRHVGGESWSGAVLRHSAWINRPSSKRV